MSRRLFIQNYETYNAGNIDGQWYKLDDYADLEDLEAAVKANNRRNAEEFMIADHEGFPRGAIGNYDNYSKAFELHQELDGVDSGMLSALIDAFGVHYFDDIAEAARRMSDLHAGTAEDEKEFAREWAEGAGLMDNLKPNDLRYYIDWQHYWNGSLQFQYLTGRDTDNTLHFFHNR